MLSSIITFFAESLANLTQSGCILLLLDEPTAPNHMKD